MVLYKKPVLIKVGTTPGFVAGQTIAILNGTGDKADWRGLDIIPEKIGFGTQRETLDPQFSWDKNTGTWINGIPFEQDEFFHIEFGLKENINNQIVGSTPIGYYGFVQYPHDAIFNLANWSDGSSNEVTMKCRIESGPGAMRGFNQELGTPTAIVYFPLPMIDVQISDQLTVKNGNIIRASGPVLQFSKGQLNARVWM